MAGDAYKSINAGDCVQSLVDTFSGLHLLTSSIWSSHKSASNPLHIYSLRTPWGLHEEWSGVEDNGEGKEVDSCGVWDIG
jgi:hypothetical protein